jgi:hypothetical protein
MTQATMTTSTPAAPSITSITWEDLCGRNGSLESWLRSATVAGSKGLGWWVRWASDSRALKSDINLAVATATVFHEALTVARSKISEAYQAGVVAAEQAREREAIELRRQAAQQAPPAPRRRWEAWP